MEQHAANLLRDGIDALNEGNSHIALQHFEAAAVLDDDPKILSYLAFCTAKERNDFHKAIALCREAIEEDPGNSGHYLILGRIHLLNNCKQDAIRVFRDGLLREKNRSIRDELRQLGIRKYPVIPSLPRDHLVNRFLGKLLSRLRIR
jgi:tetratricopeptide (TPR) repeat protein